MGANCILNGIGSNSGDGQLIESTQTRSRKACVNPTCNATRSRIICRCRAARDRDDRTCAPATWAYRKGVSCINATSHDTFVGDACAVSANPAARARKVSDQTLSAGCAIRRNLAIAACVLSMAIMEIICAPVARGCSNKNRLPSGPDGRHAAAMHTAPSSQATTGGPGYCGSHNCLRIRPCCGPPAIRHSTICSILASPCSSALALEDY